MDGNGRWATQRGLSRSQGHKAGTETAKATVTACRELGIRHLTLYTFSRENWSRPADEIRTLFDLLVQFLRKELPSLMEQNIRMHVFGELAEMPLAVRKVLQHAMKKTAGFDAMHLNLALNYSGRAELVRACRELVREGLDPADVTEEALSSRLYSAGQPDPDLIIRTSGELRISNFLLFQAAYSEFYFTETLWPDFDQNELQRALEAYRNRQRRFGQTGEQSRP